MTRKRSRLGIVVPIFAFATLAAITVAGVLVSTGKNFAGFHKTASSTSNADVAMLATAKYITDQSNILITKLQSSINTSLVNLDFETLEDTNGIQNVLANNRYNDVKAFVKFLDTNTNLSPVRNHLRHGLNFNIDLKAKNAKSNSVVKVALLNSIDVVKPQLKESDKKYAASLISKAKINEKEDLLGSNIELYEKYTLPNARYIRMTKRALEALINADTESQSTSSSKDRYDLLKVLLDTNEDGNVDAELKSFFAYMFNIDLILPDANGKYPQGTGIDLETLPNGLTVDLQIANPNYEAPKKADPHAKGTTNSTSNSSNKNKQFFDLNLNAAAQIKFIGKSVDLPDDPCLLDPESAACQEAFTCPDGRTKYVKGEDACYDDPYAQGCCLYCEKNINCAICGTGCPRTVNTPTGGPTGTPPKDPPELNLGLGSLSFTALNTTNFYKVNSLEGEISPDNPLYFTKVARGQFGSKNKATGYYFDENGNLVMQSVTQPKIKRKGKKKRPRVQFSEGSRSIEGGNLNNNNEAPPGLDQNLQMTHLPGLKFVNPTKPFLIRKKGPGNNLSIDPSKHVLVKSSAGSDGFYVYDRETGAIVTSFKKSEIRVKNRRGKHKKPKKLNGVLEVLGKQEDLPLAPGTDGAKITRQVSADMVGGNDVMLAILRDTGERIQHRVNRKPKNRGRWTNRVFKQYKRRNETHRNPILSNNLGQAFANYFQASAEHWGTNDELNKILSSSGATSFDQYLHQKANEYKTNSLDNGRLPTDDEMQNFIKGLVNDVAKVATNGNEEAMKLVNSEFDKQANATKKPYVNDVAKELDHKRNEALNLYGREFENLLTQKDNFDKKTFKKKANRPSDFKVYKKFQRKIKNLRNNWRGSKRKLKKRLANLRNQQRMEAPQSADQATQIRGIKNKIRISRKTLFGKKRKNGKRKGGLWNAYRSSKKEYRKARRRNFSPKSQRKTVKRKNRRGKNKRSIVKTLNNRVSQLKVRLTQNKGYKYRKTNSLNVSNRANINAKRMYRNNIKTKPVIKRYSPRPKPRPVVRRYTPPRRVVRRATRSYRSPRRAYRPPPRRSYRRSYRRRR